MELTSKKYFVYKLIPPRPTFHLDMTDQERTIMRQHSAYWRNLANKGVAVVFGPVADPHGGWGLAVVEAESEAQVAELGTQDPAVTSGMATYEFYAMPMAVLRESAQSGLDRP